MDNTFIKDDVIERYVLNQLNDEELATFRGQLMFDENLRKQVVETKMLMQGLAAIASEGIVTNSNSTITATPATRSNTPLRAAMIIGLLLLAGMTYYFVSSSDKAKMEETPKKSIQIPIDDTKQETAPQNTPSNSTEEKLQPEKTVEPKDESEEKIFASKDVSQPQVEIENTIVEAESEDAEEIAFGAGVEETSFFNDDRSSSY